MAPYEEGHVGHVNYELTGSRPSFHRQYRKNYPQIENRGWKCRARTRECHGGEERGADYVQRYIFGAGSANDVEGKNTVKRK